ncbi:hypothetical protein [Secundilactobacillus folii]|uniref:Glycosyl hydrolase family 8 n=1 Tax=Secundilactobacillus folii TaxID=2678357 RepID=A0A7X2XUJ1_9LACO|nr:hypothetical protein [Secundilactobacillus folii]MTV81849.1 hypothetical protein [Secundilactobacillus folii]
MKRFWLIVMFVSITVFIQGCAARHDSTAISHQQTAVLLPSTHYSTHTQQVDDLAGFVKAQLVTPKGIYSQNQVGNQPNFLLSESAGLWLIYLANTGQFQEYRRFYQQTVTTFGQEGILMYRVTTPNQTRATVNATLDDLRVIRSLGLYSAKTHSHVYLKKATTRFARLWQKVGVGDYWHDLYDVKDHQVSPLSSLAYYDLLTLKVFDRTLKDGKQRYQRQLKFVQNGFLGHSLPLYAVNYNWQNHRYSRASLNTSEALLTLLHLAEVHKLRSDSLMWLRQRINAAKLYNGYNVQGEVTDWGQSAANYAIAAQIFATVKQRGLYNQAMNQVWRFQIKLPSSKLSGSLGDSKHHVSYAFNDLEALQASVY